MNTNETNPLLIEVPISNVENTIHCNILTYCLNYIYEKINIVNCSNFKNFLELEESSYSNTKEKINDILLPCNDFVEISKYYNLLRNYILQCKDSNLDKLKCKFFKLILKNESNVLPISFNTFKEFEKNFYLNNKNSNVSTSEYTIPIIVGVVLCLLVFFVLSLFFIFNHYYLKDELLVKKIKDKNVEMRRLDH